MRRRITFRDYIDLSKGYSLDKFFQSHESLENLRKRLIKVNPNDVSIKKIGEESNDMRTNIDGVKRGYIWVSETFNILLNTKIGKIPIGKVETFKSSGDNTKSSDPFNYKEVSYLWIHPLLRRMGISSHLLKKLFSGYHIQAGNPRVIALYKRLGHDLSNKEKIEMANGYQGFGRFKIN